MMEVWKIFQKSERNGKQILLDANSTEEDFLKILREEHDKQYLEKKKKIIKNFIKYY